MVGGTVVGIARHDGEPSRLTVGGTGGDEGDRLCVYVREVYEDPISLGDSVWWAGGFIRWTPKPDNGLRDIKLEKVGYSFRPDGAEP